MLSSNPTLGQNVFTRERELGAEKMTISGTVNKSFILLSLVFATALWSWQVMTGQISAPAYAQGIFMGGALAGFLIGMLTIFVKKISPYTAPLYALCEGLVLGFFSAIMEQRYGGIVFQGVLGTFGTFFFMLFMYQSKMIQATDAFKRGMTMALGGLLFIYVISFILSFFGKNIPYIHESGPIGIAFSVIVVGLASFCLILDFDAIEAGERVGAPKYMEWYSAFSLLVTLIWLYMEILRLLAKFRDRR